VVLPLWPEKPTDFGDFRKLHMDGNGLLGSDLDAWTLSKALLNLMMMLGGFRSSLWSIFMSFLLLILIFLSSDCSVVYTGV
jgi:hypothetical protein